MKSKDTTKRMSAELRVVQLVEQVDAERTAAANERQAAQEASAAAQAVFDAQLRQRDAELASEKAAMAAAAAEHISERRALENQHYDALEDVRARAEAREDALERK